MKRRNSVICAWVDLFTALVAVLSFSFIWPNWEFKIRAYFVRKEIEKSSENKKTNPS